MLGLPMSHRHDSSPISWNNMNSPVQVACKTSCSGREFLKGPLNWRLWYNRNICHSKMASRAAALYYWKVWASNRLQLESCDTINHLRNVRHWPDMILHLNESRPRSVTLHIILCILWVSHIWAGAGMISKKELYWVILTLSQAGSLINLWPRFG
jgi:hypothetical protein